jgi:hypothetical protein
MDPRLAFGVAGSFFSLDPTLTRVQEYIRQVEEMKEVKARLRIILAPLEGYRASVKASNESAATLRITIDGLSLPVKASEVEDLARGMMKFMADFKGVVSGVIGFAKASRTLVEELGTFMEKVQRTMPDVAEVIKFFGRHYEPKTGTLDLASFPTFFAAYVVEVKVDGLDQARKENGELTKTVTEGGKSVDKAMKAAKSIGQQNLRIRDRHLKRDFPNTFKGFFKEMGKLKATAEVAAQLSKNSAPWLLELAKILERVQMYLEEQAKHVYRSPDYKTTAHRKR